MKIFIEVSSSLEKFFNGRNELGFDDGISRRVEDLFELCGVPYDEVGIIIKNGIKASMDDVIADGDKIKLFPPIIAG